MKKNKYLIFLGITHKNKNLIFLGIIHVVLLVVRSGLSYITTIIFIIIFLRTHVSISIKTNKKQD